jgi:aliphatic sulfonates family ABC transporter substrate-binding protein
MPGWLEAADGGTLFLDEIGDLPPPIQVKLLRVLQEREVVRLGARRPIAFDVRVVAATNVDLAEAVAAGRFREDLFYRLNVATLAVRPLRERPGDIVPLAEHFLAQYAERLGAGAVALTPAAASALVEHDWPGNIRELENVIHHAVVICHAHRITPADLRFPTRPRRATAPAAGAAPSADLLAAALESLFEQNLPNLHEHVEAALVRAAYRFCDRNQVQTARLLGVSRNIVRARLIQFGELSESPRPVTPTEAPRLRIVGGRLRVGYQKFGLLGVVKARGALAARGLDVDWVEFPGGTQLLEAMQAGRIDLGVVGEGPPVVAQAARAPIVYLGAEPPAPEDEAIIVPADSPIASVADLKGKTIALNKGANVELLLLRALEEAGLRADDVRIAFVPPMGARAAFEGREIDAWAIWNPLLASMLHSGGARVLRDGRGLCANVAYYIGTRALAAERPELMRSFLDEVRAVGQWANEHRDEVAALLGEQLRMDPAALRLALARTRFGVRPLDDETLATQQRVADRFFRARIIPRAVRVADAQL